MLTGSPDPFQDLPRATITGSAANSGCPEIFGYASTSDTEPAGGPPSTVGRNGNRAGVEPASKILPKCSLYDRQGRLIVGSSPYLSIFLPYPAGHGAIIAAQEYPNDYHSSRSSQNRPSSCSKRIRFYHTWHVPVWSDPDLSTWL